jgi:hypothetical protein
LLNGMYRNRRTASLPVCHVPLMRCTRGHFSVQCYPTPSRLGAVAGSTTHLKQSSSWPGSCCGNRAEHTCLQMRGGKPRDCAFPPYEDSHTSRACLLFAATCNYLRAKPSCKSRQPTAHHSHMTGEANAETGTDSVPGLLGVKGSVAAVLHLHEPGRGLESGMIRPLAAPPRTYVNCALIQRPLQCARIPSTSPPAWGAEGGHVLWHETLPTCQAQRRESATGVGAKKHSRGDE